MDFVIVKSRLVSMVQYPTALPGSKTLFCSRVFILVHFTEGEPPQSYDSSMHHFPRCLSWIPCSVRRKVLGLWNLNRIVNLLSIANRSKYWNSIVSSSYHYKVGVQQVNDDQNCLAKLAICENCDIVSMSQNCDKIYFS